MNAAEKLRAAAVKARDAEDLYNENAAFSAEYRRRVEKLVEKADNSRVRKLFNTSAKRAAVLILALGIMFGTFFTIRASRDNGLEVVFCGQGKYTRVAVDTSRSQSEPPETVEKACSPAFLPGNYRLDKTVESAAARTEYYTDGIDHIVFTQNTVYHAYLLDIELSAICSASVNGCDAYYYTDRAGKDENWDILMIFWTDDVYFYSLMLPASFGYDTAIAAAESVIAGG